MGGGGKAREKKKNTRGGTLRTKKALEVKKWVWGKMGWSSQLKMKLQKKSTLNRGNRAR